MCVLDGTRRAAREVWQKLWAFRLRQFYFKFPYFSLQNIEYANAYVK